MWTKSNQGLSVLTTASLTKDGIGNIFVAAGQFVFYSSNNGELWASVGERLHTFFVRDIAVSPDGYLFAGTQYYGLYKTILPTSTLNIKVHFG